MYISVCKYASLQQDYIYIVPDHSCREKNRIIGWMPGYDREREGEREMKNAVAYKSKL